MYRVRWNFKICRGTRPKLCLCAKGYYKDYYDILSERGEDILNQLQGNYGNDAGNTHDDNFEIQQYHQDIRNHYAQQNVAHQQYTQLQQQQQQQQQQQVEAVNPTGTT